MAEAYKKINELTEMLAVDINESTKMVVSTGVGGVSKNLNVSDLVVNNLSSSSEHRALSAAMGKKLSEEKAPLSNPQFTGTVGGITKAMVGLSDVDNTSDASKPISSATQIALNSKAATNSPVFTGVPLFSGDGAQFNCPVVLDDNVSVTGVLFGENEIGANKVLASEMLQFGPDAKIKIQTGTNGSTPIYREFPATELASSDLNGTQYVMVYGTGTPEENAAELQAAYNEAKKMPRHIGTFSSGDSIEIYKGQTFVNSAIPITHVMVANSNYSGAIALAPIGTFSRSDSQSALDAALARRVTVIIAPGEYNFGASAFTVDTEGINIVSLTGKSDVIISSTETKPYGNQFTYGIKVTADNILIKGINCRTNTFYIESYLDNLICEHCIGGNYSFGGSYDSTNGTASGTFNYCIGGNYSFGSGIGGTTGTASGIFNYCKGGNDSFGTNGIASGTFNNCVGGQGSFGSNSIASGTFNNCIGDTTSFGSYGGTLSGTFNNCVGGENSFGSYGGTISGELINCKLTSGTFRTPSGDGKIYNCIDGNGNLINTPLPIFADNAAAASLAVGTMYRTATGVQMVKF